MVNWIIETDIFEENLKKLKAEVIRQGHKCKVLSYEAFESGETYLDAFPKDEPTVFYGSLEFAAQVKRESEWIPGVIYTSNNYLCTTYYPKLSEHLLNSPYIMLPYGELINQKEFLFETLGNNGCLFVRPNGGSKSFTGTVMETERWEKDIKLAGFYNVPDNELVIVAEPLNIKNEWRFIATKHGGVISQSTYGKYEEPEFHQMFQARELARVVSDIYIPDIAWSIDICRLGDDSYKLIEIGCFSCSGLYENNLRDIVRYVSLEALEEWKDYQ